MELVELLRWPLTVLLITGVVFLVIAKACDAWAKEIDADLKAIAPGDGKALTDKLTVYENNQAELFRKLDTVLERLKEQQNQITVLDNRTTMGGPNR